MDVSNYRSAEQQVDHLLQKVVTQIEWVCQRGFVQPYKVGSSAKIEQGLVLNVGHHGIEVVILSPHRWWRSLPVLAFADTDSDLEMCIAMLKLSVAKARLRVRQHLLPVRQNDHAKSEWKKYLPERQIHIAE